ncbi:MAG: ROK family protein [Actinomycetota bacterium]|nr:ROK family protein [Actinomycetota bacterium]
MTTVTRMTQLVCVEVGGGGVETVLLDPDGRATRHDGVEVPEGLPLLIAVPGLVADGRVIAATNLGWYDVDPAQHLGLAGPATLVCNDAEAAALGESILRPGYPDLVFLGLGTGVGGAVVVDGRTTTNLFAHSPGFSSRPCSCGRTGCLETVAAGWALPEAVDPAQLPAVAEALAQAVEAEPLAVPELVVLAGGLTAAHPELIELLAAHLPTRTVVGTAASGTKSAAAWGLRHLLLNRTPA